jgi:hypothetical protein
MTIMSASHEDWYTFMIMSHSLFLKMINVVDKIVEKIKTYILCSINFILKNHAIYELMWKNIVELDTPQMTIWHMRFTCWILKATNTHSECVVLVFFFYLLLHERTPVLRYVYTTCLGPLLYFDSKNFHNISVIKIQNLCSLGDLDVQCLQS